MDLSLYLKENDYLTNEEKHEIDVQIDAIIQKHRGNSIEINNLVFDSITALTASEARVCEMSEQGMLKRIWGGLTGKNQRLQSEIDRNLARAQYSSQQTLQKLAEQNLMSFELITVVNNKLNSSILEIENEINKIYGTLITFFKQTKSDLIQLENRVDKLERNVNLLNWLNTLEYQMYNGVEYSELSKIEKIVCIVKDFYAITKEKWTTSDLLILKSALSQIDLSVKDSISYKEFIEYISENRSLLNELVKEDIVDLIKVEANQVAIINSVVKVSLLESDEKYIVNTLKSQLKTYGIEEDEKKLRYSIVEKYIAETALIDIKSQVNLFDFIIELLFNIKIASNEILNKYLNSNINFKSLDYNLAKKYAEKGNEKAQYELGERYYNGDTVDKNYEEALKWFKLSADNGNSDAQAIVSLMYEYIFDEDNDARAKYMEMALVNSHPAALFIKGMDLLSDDSEQSIDYMKVAAIKGINEKNLVLNNLFMNLFDQLLDGYFNEIFEDFHTTVECPPINAAINFWVGGVLYSQEKPYEGIEFMKNSFNQGFTEAALFVGMVYYEGYKEFGLSPDKKEALKWLDKATEKGCEWANKFISENY